MQLALLLTEAAAAFVIVGGTARLLRGDRHTPSDLDVAATSDQSVRLSIALRALSPGPRAPQPKKVGPWRVITSWSPLDVFVEDDLPAWHTIEIDGTRLWVADE
ncbi:hypothetical protein [Amnibacterium soli]|uniref:hypothetical protein n=1 Tax=Amnibacterium soli TaxID=1282736 RepID=UPI0031E62DA0